MDAHDHSPDVSAFTLDVSLALASSPDVEEMLSVIARRVADALGVWECDIYEYSPDADALIAAALWAVEMTAEDRAWLGTLSPLDERPGFRQMLRKRRARVFQADDPELADADRSIMRRWGERSALSVPLVFQDHVIGALTLIEKRDPRQFSAEDVRLVELMAVPAAVAVHSARMMRREAEQNRRLAALLGASRGMTSSVDLEDVLNTVARMSAELLDSEECQIQEYDAAGNTVRPVALWQRVPDTLAPSSLGHVFSLEGEPQERAFLEAGEALEQRRSDPDLPQRTRDAFERFGDKSYLNVPLVFNDQPVGVLVLVEKKHERHWSEEEIALAQGLAEQAAVAIEHARLYKRVQDQAITDGLTGLYNHRYFYERLDQEIARARRYGTPVSLLMIDLDDFKLFNDRNGHLAGDAVLRTMADLLRSELRQNLDIAARYGGEEFAVILPNTPMTGASEAQMEMDLSGRLTKARGGDVPPPPGHRGGAELIAERIRTRVAGARFEGADGTALPGLTVSIGVAEFPRRTSSPEDLVGHADAALYVAKRGGKDRVETYG